MDTYLSFDPEKVDTSLAKDYITKKEIIDQLQPNQIWDLIGKRFVDISQIYLMELPTRTRLNKKLRNLSKKVLDNSELFCQLEYLMRKVDVDETKNCHLKLLTQYLRMDIEKLHLFRGGNCMVMVESTPLYYLGHVATMLRSWDYHIPRLVCNKNTAPICQLFCELCLDVGLEISCYVFHDIGDYPDESIPEMSMGCTLAITEDADIDSALDVFLDSSAQVPWKIERIYAQESVNEEVMDALEMRCSRVASDRCVAAFRTARGRLVECGAGAGAGGGVPLRTFRGARDLLALLPVGGSLSLWCGTTAAAHELALASPADIVWIDDYAAFDGPPEASIPLYNFAGPRRYIASSDQDLLLKLQRTWTVLSLDERKAVVLGVLEKLVSDGNDETVIAKLADGISSWTPGDLVEVAQNRITMVIDRPTETLCCDSKYQMLEILKMAILGYRIVPKKHNNITSELFKGGVPVKDSTHIYSKDNSQNNHEVKNLQISYNKKVIHSRFGTIYSN